MRRGKLILPLTLFAFLLLPEMWGAVDAQQGKKILSIEAYDMLNTVPDTYLIDVRTRAEYQFVGHPFKAYLFPYMFMSTDLAKEDDQSALQATLFRAI